MPRPQHMHAYSATPIARDHTGNYHLAVYFQLDIQSGQVETVAKVVKNYWLSGQTIFTGTPRECVDYVLHQLPNTIAV